MRRKNIAKAAASSPQKSQKNSFSQPRLSPILNTHNYTKWCKLTWDLKLVLSTLRAYKICRKQGSNLKVMQDAKRASKLETQYLLLSGSFVTQVCTWFWHIKTQRNYVKSDRLWSWTCQVSKHMIMDQKESIRT